MKLQTFITDELQEQIVSRATNPKHAGGRPPSVPGEPHEHQIGGRVNLSTLLQIKHIMSTERISMGEIVRRALVTYCAKWMDQHSHVDHN